MTRIALRIIGAVLAVIVAASCATNQQQAAYQASEQARNAVIYVNKNQVELANYNARQEIADNPTTILWCTSSFPQPNSPIFTVPVVGKLTSSGKRPYNGDPGPDGMYGSSSEYRYGFTPAGYYVDFYNISTYCTTELTVFQRQSTVIMLAQDNSVNTAQKAAQAALSNGDKAKATQILLEALKKP